MKQLFTIVVLLIGMIGTTQEIHNRGFNIFFSVGQDIKMAYEGPYAGQENDIGSTFNLEFKAGLEWETWRAALGVETHNEINYNKYFIEIGYLFNNPLNENNWLKNITIFTGLEASLIERISEGHHFTNPNHFRPDNHYWSFGTNIELLYNFTNYLSAGINWNVFLPEAKDSFGNKITKTFRQDVMFNIYIKI